jgi:ATP-dependent DNA ligase
MTERRFSVGIRIKVRSFLIDGEAVILNDDGTSDFHALRGGRRGAEAILVAFNLIEHSHAHVIRCANSAAID